MSRSPTRRPYRDGYVRPGTNITSEEATRRLEAEIGSQRLLEAVLRLQHKMHRQTIGLAIAQGAGR